MYCFADIKKVALGDYLLFRPLDVQERQSRLSAESGGSLEQSKGGVK